MKSSPPSHSISQILVFTLCLTSITYMGVLIDIRAKMTNQSAFEINGNGLFLIISIFSMFVAEITSVILFTTNLATRCYACVKRIAMFSANFSLWSLMLVLNNAPKQKLIVYLLCFVFFGMTLTHVCAGNDDRDLKLDKKSPIPVFAYVGLVNLPIALVIVLCAPKNLEWMVYSLIYPTVGMEVMCVFMIFVKIMFLQGTQQDKDTSDLIAHKDQNK